MPKGVDEVARSFPFFRCPRSPPAPCGLFSCEDDVNVAVEDDSGDLIGCRELVVASRTCEGTRVSQFAG